MTEEFAGYSSPPGDPPRLSREQESGGLGLCGTVASDAKRLKDNSRLGSSPEAILGWFLPWFFMMAVRGILRFGQRSRLARSTIGS